VRFHQHAALNRLSTPRKLDALAWRMGQRHPFELVRAVLDAVA
jgi:hypothetical protein